VKVINYPRTAKSRISKNVSIELIEESLVETIARGEKMNLQTDFAKGKLGAFKEVLNVIRNL